MYKKINLDQYERKKTFDFYKSYDDPFFNITCNVNINGLYSFCKKNDYSFLLASLHVCMKVANEIPEFKHRIVNNEILEYELIHPGSTILKEDETFTFGYFNYHPIFSTFHEEGKKEIDFRKNSIDLEPEKYRSDLIYFTSIPWVSFTQFKHARSGKTDSIPRIVFGKYFKQGDDLLMPISIEVHHALVDGIHVGKFIEKLTRQIA